MVPCLLIFFVRLARASFSLFPFFFNLFPPSLAAARKQKTFLSSNRRGIVQPRGAPPRNYGERRIERERKRHSERRRRRRRRVCRERVPILAQSRRPQNERRYYALVAWWRHPCNLGSGQSSIILQPEFPYPFDLRSLSLSIVVSLSLFLSLLLFPCLSLYLYVSTHLYLSLCVLHLTPACLLLPSFSLPFWLRLTLSLPDRYFFFFFFFSSLTHGTSHTTNGVRIHTFYFEASPSSSLFIVEAFHHKICYRRNLRNLFILITMVVEKIKKN